MNQQRRNDDIAARLQTAVRLQYHTAPKIVHDQRLVRLGNAEFPWQSRVLDTRQRRCTGPPGVT